MSATIYNVEYRNKKNWGYKKIVANSFEQALEIFRKNYIGNILGVRAESEDVHLKVRTNPDVDFE